MKIGVLELLTGSVAQGRIESFYNARFRRHYTSIGPQAVAAWCRQLGHDVTYSTYYGQVDPRRLLPDALDVLFISTYTQASALAYALGKLYRREKTLTVIGGPHAKSFPTDCLRFFDLVVCECDKSLIDDILRKSFDRGTIVTRTGFLRDLPSVEERLPEITVASLTHGRRMLSHVSMLTSLGCPYSCDFCVDWNKPYALLPRDRLVADLRFVSENMPGMIVSFDDPNFGVKFEQVFGALETIPENARNPYVIESSLSNLRSSRLGRLQESNCVYVAPGIESWAGYSNKSSVSKHVGKEKLATLVAHFEELYGYIPGLQANFMFGTDIDAGDEPVELTKEFIRRLPFVWPTINIPIPFGGTPLYDSYVAAGRLLKSMPFSFYYTPCLVTVLKNYQPLEYYEKLIEMFSVAYSARMLIRRMSGTRTAILKGLHALRTLSMRSELSELRRTRNRLRDDPAFRTFHDGRSDTLPGYYRRSYRRRLGAYSELITDAEMAPEMEMVSLHPCPDHKSSPARPVPALG